ncbi:hypothetical protein [Persephonella sp.]
MFQTVIKLTLLALILSSCGGKVGVNGKVELNRNFQLYLNSPDIKLKIK